jgi:small basic protein
MTVFGKTLSQYLSFQKYILWLILVVGLARLGLSLAGVPNSATKWLSISVVALIGLVYYAIRVHTTGFGSYKQLLPLVFIQSVLSQAIVIVGIVIAIATHKDNVFSAPEFSGGVDGKTWTHAAAHLVVGVVIAPLVGWLIGSALMWVTKKVTAQEPAAKGQGA